MLVCVTVGIATWSSSPPLCPEKRRLHYFRQVWVAIKMWYHLSFTL